jgi:imidazolonepropionase-like amidohydrolase
MNRWSVLVWSILLFVSVGLAGQQGNQQVGVVVKAGRILDVRTGVYQEHQLILIAGGRIRAVGEERELQAQVPSSARVVDLSCCTVLPGLIDAHTHLTMSPYLTSPRARAVSAPRQALLGARNARITLEAGFTTTRDVGASGYADVALRDAINAGDVPGPRMLASGPPIGSQSTPCEEDRLAPQFHFFAGEQAGGVFAAMARVREDVRCGADLIKFYATGGVLSQGDDPEREQYSPEEMQTIAQMAHRLSRKVAAHAHGAKGIKDAVLAGVDSIEHGSFVDDADIRLMKQHGTYLVPTLYVGDWFLENQAKLGFSQDTLAKAKIVVAASRQNVPRAFREKVKVAFGTDAGVYPHGLNAREFSVMVKLGLTPLAAIQSATLHAADLLGWADRVGTLEPGKYADLIAVEGNPLKDVTTLEKVKVVMKGGEVVQDTRERKGMRRKSDLDEPQAMPETGYGQGKTSDGQRTKAN